MEINRLTKELGKEKVENTRLNADLIRIRAERDAFKQQVVKDQEKAPNPGKKQTSLGQRPAVSGLEAEFSGVRVHVSQQSGPSHSRRSTPVEIVPFKLVRGKDPIVPLYPQILTVNEIMNSCTIAALGELTKRPSLKGKFKNHDEIMLYDTGSAITCMSDVAY